jgi:hypothetical protein
MIGRRCLLGPLALLLCIPLAGCPDDDDGDGDAPPGVGASDASTSDASAVPGATSDCEVAYSCRASVGGTLASCTEASRGSDAAKGACEAQSAGERIHEHSDDPCPRSGLAGGCLVREADGCMVSWVYGNQRDIGFFAQQCESEGHEFVTQ